MGSQAVEQGLISIDESTLLRRFVEYSDHAIQVDDFPQDFGLTESLQKRRDGLARTTQDSADVAAAAAQSIVADVTAEVS